MKNIINLNHFYRTQVNATKIRNNRKNNLSISHPGESFQDIKKTVLKILLNFSNFVVFGIIWKLELRT